MLTFEHRTTDKHLIKIGLRRKNIRFLRRTNLIKTRCHKRISALPVTTVRLIINFKNK